MTEWNYYVGDPCYMIDDKKWCDFCDALWAKQAEEEKKGYGRYNYPIILEWDCLDEDGDPAVAEIEVWSSPFGDGSWNFSNTVKSMSGWVAGTYMGVDAGLLAIVPRECCERTDMGGMEYAHEMGILFTSYPELQTGENLDGYVLLQGFHGDDYYECECGSITTDDQMWWCDGCGTSACGSCGGNCDCRECSCGEYYDSNGWSDSGKCSSCEQEEEE